MEKIGKPKQKLRESKKAIMLIVALVNINCFIFLGSTLLKIPNEIIINGITAVLFLVGVYTGCQGGIDMVQSNRFDYQKKDINEQMETVEETPRPKYYDNGDIE